MKTKLFFSILFSVFFLLACVPATIPVPTVTVIPSQTATQPISTLVIPSPTPTIFWIMATPLNLSTSNNGDIDTIIKNLHPEICAENGDNLALLTPPSNIVPPPPLEVTEITELPEPSPGYVNELADNIDHSLTAVIGCQPENCGNLYVKNNKTNKFYKMNFGALDFIPLVWLQWINRGTVLVAQVGEDPSHMRYELIVAINVEKQSYEYYSFTSRCISTPIPTP